MIKEDETKTIFLGKNSVFITYTKKEGNKFLVKKINKTFPFLSKWVVIFHNLKDHLDAYEQRVLFDLEGGRTKELIRIIYMDFDTLEPNCNQYNPSLLDENRSLKLQLNSNFQREVEIKELLSISNNDAKLRMKIKDIMDFNNSIKAQFTPNTNHDQKKK